MNRTNTIYADYQATTPVDPRVLERMMPYWQESFGNPHSSDHVVGWQAAEAVRDSLTSVAGLIGADPDEIVFTSGATEANNLALFGSARRAPQSRRRILVSAIEHKCVLEAARALKCARRVCRGRHSRRPRGVHRPRCAWKAWWMNRSSPFRSWRSTTRLGLFSICPPLPKCSPAMKCTLSLRRGAGPCRNGCKRFGGDMPT